MADSRPKVGLDIDGVLGGFTQKFVALANRRFGLTLDAKDQTAWDFQCLGLTDAQCNEVYDEIHSTPNFWMSLEPLPNTATLSEYNKHYRVFFITSRMYAPGLPLEDQTANWLRRHFFIANPTVIVSPYKGPLAAALNLEYFLDDRTENVLDVLSFNPYVQVFLQDAPYNKEFSQRRIERVSSVDEFFEAIQGGVNGSRSEAAA